MALADNMTEEQYIHLLRADNWYNYGKSILYALLNEWKEEHSALHGELTHDQVRIKVLLETNMSLLRAHLRRRQ